MTKKFLYIISALVIGLFAFMGFKIMALENTGSDLISLSTSPNPPRLGQTSFIITVKDKNGKPVDDAKVNFDLNMVTMNMGVQQGEATPQGNGQYAAAGRLSMGGPWGVTTKVTMPNGEVVGKNFTINVY